MDVQTAATLADLRQQLDAARKEADFLRGFANNPDLQALRNDLARERSRADVLAAEVRGLLAVIDAHEIDTLDCDRTDNKYCDCLQRQMDKIRAALDPTKYKPVD